MKFQIAMIQLYLWVVLWIWDVISLPSARFIRETTIAAEESFGNGDYLKAAILYKQVVDASIFSDPAGRLNMAHAYFLAGETERAYQNYLVLSRVDDEKLAAKARSQMAVIALGKGDTVQALGRLREAILLDRSNRSAVTDFEILRHRFSGKIETEGAEQPKSAVRDSLADPVENIPVQEQLNNAVVEQSDQREQLLQNLDKINMSEEQARSVLDAMKVNERQYIYQLRRSGVRGTVKSGKKVEW
ncbi:MAG: hypothetical protein ABS46_14470 [Cytophagaceae bacterium SCN 52-12]|nr:MAG: hypothetical protein ABS46_14470 [Cytophagaceae bacterium SCN 52-12]